MRVSKITVKRKSGFSTPWQPALIFFPPVCRPPFLRRFGGDRDRLAQLIEDSTQSRSPLVDPIVKKLRASLATLSPEERATLDTYLPELSSATSSLAPHHLVRAPERLTEAKLPDDHRCFERLQEVVKKLERLLNNAPSFSLYQEIRSLKEAYLTYIKTLQHARTFEERRPYLSAVSLLTKGSLDNTFISQEMAYLLLSLDVFGLITKTNQTGSSATDHVGSLWIKKNQLKIREGQNTEGTLDPSMEAAIHAFHTLFFGDGVVPSTLLVLSQVPHKQPQQSSEAEGLIQQAQDPNRGRLEIKRIKNRLHEESSLKNQFTETNTSHSVQVSQAIAGELLGDFLHQAHQTPSLFDMLDRPHVQRLILSSLLTRPADAKADNAIVTFPDKSGQRRIISIDNDLSFADPVIQERASFHSVGLKNILYCYPELMTQPLDSAVRTQVLALKPELYLLQWLRALQFYNHTYDSLKEEMGAETFALLKLPLHLRAGTVRQLLEDVKRLQQFLHFPPHGKATTLQDVFQHLQPLTAAYYARALQTPRPSCQTPLERFHQIYNNQVFFEELFQDTEDMAGSSFKERLKREQARPKDHTPRSQSIDEAARELFEAIDWIALSDKGVAVLEEALPFFPALLKTLSPETYPHLLHDLIPHHPSPPLLKALIDLFPAALHQWDGQGLTPLHYAVLHSKTLALTLLLQKTQDPQQRTRNGKTPLDLACEQQQEESFITLINHHAHQVEPNVALAFYKNKKLLPSSPARPAFLQLLKRHQELDWRFALDVLLPPAQHGHLRVRTTSFGDRSLAPDLKDLLLDANQRIRRQNASGRHAVGELRQTLRAGQESHALSLYFKEYPELPGLEEAAGSLLRQLIGFGAPYSDLIRIGERPVLVSQGIQSGTLKEVLQETPEILQDLHPSSLSALILASMLINPEDGKPDNYMLEPFGRFYRLIAIDNDHAFVPAVAREQPQASSGRSGRVEPVVQVKTILYCLDYMTQRIPPEVRDLFLKRNMGDLLEQWLTNLQRHQTSYSQLFSQAERQALLSTQQSYIGIPFQKGAIPALYTKMRWLQQLLHDKPQLTHLELLCKLEPLLGRRYKKAFTTPRSVMERFQLIDGLLFARDGSTITSSGHILKALEIPLKESLLDTAKQESTKAYDYGPKKALNDFKESRRYHALDVLRRTDQGLTLNFSDLTHPALKGFLEQRLAAVDFKDITKADQDAVFALLKDQLFYHLSLKNARALSDQQLTSVRFDHLLSLDLRGALSLTDGFLPALSQQAPSLESLNLRNTGLKKVFQQMETIVTKQGFFFSSQSILIEQQSLLFPALEALDLGQCGFLEVVKLEAPLLKRIHLDKCPSLKTFTLTAPLLQRFHVAFNPWVTTQQLGDWTENYYKTLKLEKRDVEGCKGIFETWTTWLDLWRGNFKGGQSLQKAAQEGTLTLTGYDLSSFPLDRFIQHHTLLLDQILSLDLSSSKIGAAGAKALSILTKLTRLNLKRNHIGDEGAQALEPFSQSNDSRFKT